MCSGLNSAECRQQEESSLESSDTRGHKKHGPWQKRTYSFLQVRAPEKSPSGTVDCSRSGPQDLIF